MASSSSAPPSQSAPKLNYEVFLSFRGEDVRKNFLDHLYDKLKLKAIHTFKDDDQLRIGDSIGPSLLQAIEESRIAVVIFSEDYASSTWCLREVEAIMECKEKHGQIVVPIFYNVEPSDVRKQKGRFGKSFAELEKRFNDDVGKANIERWKKALAKAADIKGHTLTDYNGYEAVCLQRVTDDIFSRLKKFIQATTTVLEKNIVGLESRVGEIRNLLRMEPNDVQFIGIWGMGGIGKTTTARAVFNKFSNQFGGGACFLADVRQVKIIKLQKKLIKTILNVPTDSISDVHAGMETIVKRLKEKKVLIVLDDVDHVEQLDKLAGDLDWFGGGSRVIITTRDAGVLRRHGVDEKYIYEVPTMEDQEAIQLFRSYAFKKKPRIGVEELCGSIVDYCKGLPLALQVLGSSLCGLEAAELKSTLEELKISLVGTPNDKIDEVLKISFDRLDSNTKTIFLHIACFFRNRKEEYVKDALKSCDLQPVNAMRNLIEKSLISLSLYGEIEMHDLIQEMGWRIASQEKPRSRVWQPKDVDDVLSGKMEPKHIEGILFPSTYEWHNDEYISCAFEALKDMGILKILIVDTDDKIFHDMDTYLSSSELTWIDFKSYGFTSLRITKKLNKLTYLGLSESYSLLESPNFDMMPNLKRLNLSHCSKLKEIHSSIGNLKELVLLDLRGCSGLGKLPNFNQVSSLRFLDLRYCRNLIFFPEIKTKAPDLKGLDLEEVGIKEVPSSIRQLHGLTKLHLIRCENLVRLCDGLCELKNLKVLKIKWCSKIESLPQNLNGLTSLDYLNLQGSGFVSLPESLSKLHLQYLDITSCGNLENLPKLPKSMKELYVDCHFAFGRNIFELANKCSELYSVSLCCEDEFEVGTCLATKFIPIHFPLCRKNSLSFSYPIPKADILRSFKYRRYGSNNGISINLSLSWYSKNFWGFAICFRPLTGDVWRPHSYQDIDGHMEHCVIIAKLSHRDNNKIKDLQTECVIVGSKAAGFYIDGHMCFVYIRFSSLWPGSETTKDGVTPNDYSRFEVAFSNLEASAYYWGCSLLYHEGKKKKKKKCISISRVSPEALAKEVNREVCINSVQVPKNICTLVPAIGSVTSIGSTTCSARIEIKYYTNFMWTNLASWDVNLPGRATKIGHLTECVSRLHYYHYLDCTNDFRRCEKQHQLPANIRELYACHTLATESNIAELATKYSELYSVSFSDGRVTLSAEELARKFVSIYILTRNTPFAVTYITTDKQADINMRWFKDSSHNSNKVSIDLNPTWYSKNFMGFVVCLKFSGREIWESDPAFCPFRHCEIIAKLADKDNGNEALEKKCMIGRLYNEEFDFTFGDRRLVCFAYIPFSSLWHEPKTIMDNVTPNHYSVFEVAFQDLEVSTDWSCDLLYTNDELLTDAIGRKREQEQTDSGGSDSGLDRTKLWQSTTVQRGMVSKPECSNKKVDAETDSVKVVQLVYTNSGVGILALCSNGIVQHWQPNNGLFMTDDALGSNIEKAIPCMALSKDDSCVVSVGGGKVSLFSIMEFKVIKTFMWLPSASTFLAFHPHDNNIVAIGTEDSTIYIYNVGEDKARFTLIDHQERITGLAFSTDLNMLVSSDADAQLYVWSIDTWEKKISVPNPIQLPAGEGYTQVMFHVDQVHLLVTHETQLAIYDASMMKRIRQWTPHGFLLAPISSATYSCNSQLVYASFIDGNIGVLDADTLTLRCHIAPSAYLSQVVSNRRKVVYPVVIAAHPQEPIQFAVGLSNGSVKVIELLKSKVKCEVSLPVDDEDRNGFGKVIFDDDVDSDEELPICLRDEEFPIDEHDEELHIKERAEAPKLKFQLKYMASTSSAAPSQSAPKLNYEVFLSFRGEDVRKNFLDHLYDKLIQKGLNTFKDDHQLRIGDSIAPALLQAIEESRIAVVIFSKDYASSTWCLEEVAAIMECKDKHDQIVVPIFYNVEPSHVRKQEGSFEKSFTDLEKRFNDDVGKAKIERWKKALEKAAGIKGHNLVADYSGYELYCIKEVVDDIFKKLPPVQVVEENLVGLESRLEDISKLMEVCSEDVKLIGIWGMGGIGKTTLATAYFDRFSCKFDGACFLKISKHAVQGLQTKLLKESSMYIDGLKSKRVLIVLDDAVDEEDKLEKLVGDGKWLCNGSRLIITTRDRHLFHKFGVAIERYEVKQLDVEKALKLFSWHAFKKESPEDEFEDLCRDFVSHASGLPLALKVWGSSLCGERDKKVWESTLEKIKAIPDEKVIKKLRISYDGLDQNCKTVFLDIACFFRQKSRDYIDDVLDGRNLHAATNIKVLIDRCLVFEKYGDIDMHDLIHEMGLNIERENPRSRRWQLQDLEEPKVVEGLLLSFTDRSDDENISPSIEALKQMKNLKMLIVEYDSYRYCSESLESCWMSIMDYLPRKLMLLKFPQYPLSKLFCTKNSKELSYLDLSSSSWLLETPNFEEMPNLKRLNLSGCTALTQIHPSIGNLSKLVLLDLSDCSNLEKLPSFNQVSSLKSLKLDWCKKLNFFPEIKARTPNLVELLLLEVGILELPSSIQQLHGLTKLRLNFCERLKRISNGLCELKNLEVLEIRDCSKVESLPENLQGLSSLEYLNLQGCGFVYLPESFSQLHRLHYLDITGCQKLEELPQLPSNIRELYADCRFAGGNNIADLAECSELYSVSFSYHEDIQFNVGTLAKKFIHFPLHRKNPLCAYYPITEATDILRSFTFRRYGSNGISVNLNSFWYSPNFEGFAICFLPSSECDIWRPHPDQHFDFHIEHCAVIIKLSHKDNDNEVFQIKCEIARSSGECFKDMCLIYIPFSSLWPESKTKMEANDYSRFRVEFINLKASANWGCSLLYKRDEELASWDGSLQGRTTDIGPLTKLEYLNLSGKKDIQLLPKEISQSESLKYLDISGCGQLRELPELPANIREVYAHCSLASESNIAELATKYSQLYSVSFSHGCPRLSAEELARKFVQIMRNSPFIVSYPCWVDDDIQLKYQSADSNKISIKLDPFWYRQAFVGFVCFLLYTIDRIWESSLHVISPFRHGTVTAKLIHKDNANEVLQTNCVFGRLYDREFYQGCFAYIPFCSLLSKYGGVIPKDINDYLVFEVAFLGSNASRNWSCGLLYQDDE